jgi:pimeloyl-ACP methyl ester carboxylesterase
VPTGAKLLLRSSVGLPLLRPLLRSEVAEVSLSRAFHQPGKLTPAVLARYAEPLRVLGWDRALWEVARCAGELSHGELSALAEGAAAAGTPAVVLAGAQDRVAPPEIAASMAASLGTDVLTVPDCGHLPQEESPAALASLIAPAISAWLAPPPLIEGSPRASGPHSSPERDGSGSPHSSVGGDVLVCCQV